MSFWAEGFWAEGFWAEGFWVSQEVAPTDTHDGVSRRKIVEIINVSKRVDEEYNLSRAVVSAELKPIKFSFSKRKNQHLSQHLNGSEVTTRTIGRVDSLHRVIQLGSCYLFLNLEIKYQHISIKQDLKDIAECLECVYSTLGNYNSMILDNGIELIRSDVYSI